MLFILDLLYATCYTASWYFCVFLKECLLLISSVNENIKDEPHLKALIFGWKRGLLIGDKPSKNTGSGGISNDPPEKQILRQVFGGPSSDDGVSVIYFLRPENEKKIIVLNYNMNLSA